jgi:2-enoate reductase
VCLANSSYLREWFALHKVPVYLNTTLQQVLDDRIICKDKSGMEVRIHCDSVISSAGYVPNPLSKGKKRVHLVGDCKEVGNLRTVIWRAYEVAMKI